MVAQGPLQAGRGVAKRPFRTRAALRGLVVVSMVFCNEEGVRPELSVFGDSEWPT
jgi:hypothetical protein